MVRLAAAGVPIMIGSREVSRANDTAERARKIVPDGDFQGDEDAAAAGRVTTVILCVPFSAQAHTLAALPETMTKGSLLIDATVPLAAASADVRRGCLASGRDRRHSRPASWRPRR